MLETYPTIDSAPWKELMAAKGKKELCLECREGNTVHWKVRGGKRNLGVIIENVRTKSHKEPLAKGKWSHMRTKFSIVVWRIKNQQLNTKLPASFLEKEMNTSATYFSTMNTQDSYFLKLLSS